MPELPEVETVRKGLEQLVVGKVIEKVTVHWPRIIEEPDVPLFCQLLKGQRILAIQRRGKFLIFKLTDHDLVSHLRMEGKYEFFPEATTAQLTKHTHVLFDFTDGSQLQYRDVRKFGRMALLAKDSADSYKGIQQLGPEPLPDQFVLQEFKKGLRRSHKAIKPLLLDQRLVTGLGNIYVDEALWQAKIHPEQPANTLTDGEITTLHEAIIDVLARAVTAGGTTIRTYLNALGEAGTFQLSLNVYGQTGKPCPRCGREIIKIKVAQRGTHLCPNCQTLRVRKPRQPMGEMSPVKRGSQEKGPLEHPVKRPLMSKNSFILGVTGSIATGKSTVVEVFLEQGIPVVDGDIVARQIMEPGQPALAQVAKTFGQTVLQSDGGLNRQALGEIVFSHPEKRQQLDQLLDPYLRQEIIRQLQEAAKTAPLVVADIPLLYEKGYEQYVDQVAVVYIPREIQLHRLMERDGISEKAATQRIDSQLAIDTKAERADWVIDNQGTRDETRQQVTAWLLQRKKGLPLRK